MPRRREEGLSLGDVLLYIALLLVILYFLKLMNLVPFDPPQESAAAILGLAVLTLVGESIYSRRTELKDIKGRVIRCEDGIKEIGERLARLEVRCEEHLKKS